MLVLAILLGISACSDPEAGRLVDVGSSDTDTADTGDDVDATEDADTDDAFSIDASDTDTLPDAGDTRDWAGPDEFEKPPPDPSLIPRNFASPDDFSIGPDLVYSNSISFAGRPHMRSRQSSMEKWLYAGEYFVIDGWIFHYDPDVLPLDFELTARHQGEHLPLRYVEVEAEGDWPTMEEIEAWDEDEFSYSETVEFDNGIPENMTIVIPPWAFPERGAYNVQLMLQPSWKSRPDVALLQQYRPFYRQYNVYYHSELLVDEGEDIPRAEDLAEEIPPGEVSDGFNGNFLAPPSDVYDWESVDSNQDRELGEVLETTEQELTLELRTTGTNWWLSAQTQDVDCLYYVIQDHQVIDKFVLNPDYGYHHAAPTDDGTGYLVPIDVELPEDEVSVVQVASFPNPFTRPFAPPHRAGLASNGLLLRYTPE